MSADTCAFSSSSRSISEKKPFRVSEARVAELEAGAALVDLVAGVALVAVFADVFAGALVFAGLFAGVLLLSAFVVWLSVSGVWFSLRMWLPLAGRAGPAVDKSLIGMIITFKGDL
ncbi:hypothetical protein [Roseibium polysiphoniae]|uniref:hypothetical protein n=1 Tax=Roseibium polysiphoniae TaxID=2571221 RepID=UPI0020B3FAEA|nr:hypothetical protein [Roseibium polysiphoniae]